MCQDFPLTNLTFSLDIYFLPLPNTKEAENIFRWNKVVFRVCLLPDVMFCGLKSFFIQKSFKHKEIIQSKQWLISLFFTIYVTKIKISSLKIEKKFDKIFWKCQCHFVFQTINFITVYPKNKKLSCRCHFWFQVTNFVKMRFQTTKFICWNKLSCTILVVGYWENWWILIAWGDNVRNW